MQIYEIAEDGMWIPLGFHKLDVTEVWTDGNEVVILGDPGYDEDDPETNPHNCDEMGCGAFGPHVLMRLYSEGGDEKT